MTSNSLTTTPLPRHLGWLADAPLFIDAPQIRAFYDAVVRPETEQGTTTLLVSEQKVRELSAKAGIEGTISPSDLLQKLLSILPFLKLEATAGAEIAGGGSKTDESSRTIELHPISTPQRQLVQLTLHYWVNLQPRIFFVEDAAQEDWRDPQTISAVPRTLVFLDLPGQDEAHMQVRPETKLIPTAAEFSSGTIDLLYEKLRARNGRLLPPDYPNKPMPLEPLRTARKKYWRWFDVNFDPKMAIGVIEQAAVANGRVRWIDFRVPLATSGDTLHLHISPAGEYDTGVFAYNLVARGFKHGLRLVGTLKSEPDMNVLAIYEK